MLRPPTSALLQLAFAAEHGVAAEVALKETGLTEAALKSGMKVPVAAEQRLILNVLTALGHPPGLGLAMGLRYSLASYGIWGFAVMSAPTLLSAFRSGQRTLALTYCDLEIAMHEHGDWADLVFDTRPAPPALVRYFVERDAAAIAAVQREIFLQTLPPASIHLAHADEGQGAEWQRIFGVLPVFSAGETRIRYAIAALALPMPQANPVAAEMAEAQCRQLLAERRALDGTAGLVRNALMRACGGRLPSLEDIATQLHCTSRTLRRKLTAEGSSYRALVDEVRQALAEELLGTAGMKVEEVAQRLGYSEAASFLHARKRWRTKNL